MNSSAGPAASAPPAPLAPPARNPWRWPGRSRGQAAVARWATAEGGAPVLRLGGDWRQPSLPPVPELPELPELPVLPELPEQADPPDQPDSSTPTHPHAGPALQVDGSALLASDDRLGPWLWPLLQAAVQRGSEVELNALPPRVQTLLGMALEQARREPPAAAPPPSTLAATAGAVRRGLHHVGERAGQALRERVLTLGFVGEVLLAAVPPPRSAQAARHRSLLVSETLVQLELAGPRSLPIVLLVGGLIGLILAYMGGAQLRLFGAQSFVAPLVAVGELREIGALTVGIVLAGRVGAAYAAQLATMRGSEEIDALRVMGVDPMRLLVLPRLVALLLAAPLLTAMAAACGMAAGWVVAVAVHDVAPRDYLARSLEAITPVHLAVGLFKGTLYGLLVGLAGCRQGLHAERSALGVGQATTQAVVQAIVWVTLAASVTTVLFEQLGW